MGVAGLTWDVIVDAYSGDFNKEGSQLGYAVAACMWHVLGIHDTALRGDGVSKGSSTSTAHLSVSFFNVPP